MSSSDDDYGSMQELQNVGVVTNYKRTTALRSELVMRPNHFARTGDDGCLQPKTCLTWKASSRANSDPPSGTSFVIHCSGIFRLFINLFTSYDPIFPSSYKWKNHFFKMKGDIGMAGTTTNEETRVVSQQRYTKLHHTIPISLFDVICL